MNYRKGFAVACLVLSPSLSVAETVKVEMHAVTATGVGESLGTVTLEDTEKGLKLTPALKNLPPGSRGFHVHNNPTCEPAEKDGKPAAAQAAGDHFDPAHSGKHAGPAGSGHLGDLPTLEVDADGSATKPVVSARLSLDQVQGRSIMIHAGGDNFADTPQPLGGGGARIACGVVK